MLQENPLTFLLFSTFLTFSFFIFSTQIPGDLEHAVEIKRKKMRLYKQPLQPFIIGVGPNTYDLKSFHVRFDEVTYNLPSLLQAVQLLFKFYIVYKANYPVESESICYFIQWGIFKVHTPQDTKVPYIYNTLNKF